MKTRQTTTFKKSNKTIRISQWLYASLQIKNWSSKKREMIALTIICLLSGIFTGSIYALEIVTLGYGFKDKILYFLSRAKIDWNSLIAFYEKWVIGVMVCVSMTTGLPIWVSIDDTLVEKDKRSKNVPKGGKKKSQVGFSFVTAVIGVGIFFLPLIPRKCFRKVSAKEYGLAYIPKTTVAIDLVLLWHKYGLENKIVFILTDSWYSSKKLIKKCMELNFILISGLKSNRLLNKKRIENYRCGLRKNQRVDYSEEKYSYRLYLRFGTLSGILSPIRVLLSQRIRKSDKRKSWRYILCTNPNMNATEILEMYKKRWAVETFHQIWKSVFYLKKWRFQSICGIQNMAIISVMVIGFSVHQHIVRNNDKYDLPKLTLDHCIIAIALKEMKDELISGALIQNPLIKRMIE